MTLEFPRPLDPRISAFSVVIDAHRGRYWAPDSVLPCPRPELFELLKTARRGLRAAQPSYLWLTDLMVDLTRFVPDADLLAAEPFMSRGGAITGRVFDDEALDRERDRLYEVFMAHRARRPADLDTVFIDARPAPIGEAVWSPHGRPWLVHRALDGYARGLDAPERMPLDEASAVRTVLFVGWIPGLVAALICAAVLLVIGHAGAALITLIGGPIVGCVVCFTLLFAGGSVVTRLGAGPGAQEAFLLLTMLIGAPVAVALAVLAVASPVWAVAMTTAATLFTLLVLAYIRLTG